MESLSVDKFLGRGGTLSVDVRGVDLLSIELLGKLLVEELAEFGTAARFMKTLAGLCFIFWKVERGRGFGSKAPIPRSCSALVGVFGRRLGEPGLAGILEATTSFPSLSGFLVKFRFGDGDLEGLIHDLRAKVANDSVTVFVLPSRICLEIAGTGGASLGVVTTDSEEFWRSGEPRTFCIQDLGRATKDFLLPILSNFGRSSFVSRFDICSSRPSSVCDRMGSAGLSRAMLPSFSKMYPLSEIGRLVKLADLTSSSFCCVADGLKANSTRSEILGEEADRGNVLFRTEDMVMTSVQGTSGCRIKWWPRQT